MMALEEKKQGKSEAMENEGVPMLSNDNYQEWKENMKSKLMNLGSNVWYSVCNGFTKIHPSGEEVQKNSKASDNFNLIPDSTLKRVMHYTTAKEVWDKLQEIHEGKEDCSSGGPLGNIISNDESEDARDYKATFVMSDGVTK